VKKIQNFLPLKQYLNYEKLKKKKAVPKFCHTDKNVNSGGIRE
jgi:hypothetical protein